MSDSLANGRKSRVKNIIEDYNRKSLLNNGYYSIPAGRGANQVAWNRLL